MFYELEAAHFEVVLIPAPDQRHSGHQIRACQSGNPRWYSELCAAHKSCRGIGKRRHKRPRTFIKKETTLAALNRLAGGDAGGIYGERLLRLIEKELEKENGGYAAATSFSLEERLWF